MAFEGTLTQWNEERGFGFIEVAGTRERLFVHVSSFQRGRGRPPLGTRLTFDVERDARGRKRAVGVRAASVAAAASVARSRRGRSPAWVGAALACAVLAIGVHDGLRWRNAMHEDAPATVVPRGVSAGEASPAYRCDGRTRCSQMTSCAEATWVLNHCPGTQMDGNHDGVPCEQQFCGGR